MLETAGTKLRRARTQRHLSLADASRATKIRAKQLADLESDDYSNFANLAYARGFLVSYGKYLQLDVRPYMDAFADANTFGLDDYQYLSDVPVAEYRARTRPWRKKRKSSWKQVAALAAAFVVLAVGVFSFYLYVNYKRLGGLGAVAERQAASESSGEATASSSASGPGDASQPTMRPVSSTPAPSASAPPATTAPATPDIVPNPDENRTAAAALALASQNNSPAALLTSLSMPAVKPPGETGGTPQVSPTPGKDGALLVHSSDKSADAYRADESKPRKVSNDSRH